MTFGLLLLVGNAYAVRGIPDDIVLVGSVIMSRHGIRSPYPPDDGAVDNFTAYTNLKLPTHDDWGMTSDEFKNQFLTPHGKIVMQQLGKFYKSRYIGTPLETSIAACEGIAIFADTADGVTRDNDTAVSFLQGFGCEGVPVGPVDDKMNPSLRPVVSDHFDVGCHQATEEQINGLYGGEIGSLDNIYTTQIDQVTKTLEMPPDARVCKDVNPHYNGTTCTLMETGYKYTGLYYQGMMASPFYYAGYFAEMWMFQYLSNISGWGFDKLTVDDITDLYKMHIETMQFGANIWNSRAFGSHALGYILASLEQIAFGKKLDAVIQPITNKLTVFFAHDFNVLYLKKLLGLSWTPQGFGSNVATTGGAVVFDLYQNKTKEFFVSVRYIAATPQQQRGGVDLVKTPPSEGPLVIPGCGTDLCPWGTFVKVALGSLDAQCVQQPLRAHLDSLLAPGASSDGDKDDAWSVKSGLVGGAVGLLVGAAGAFFFCRRERKGVPLLND